MKQKKSKKNIYKEKLKLNQNWIQVFFKRISKECIRENENEVVKQGF